MLAGPNGAGKSSFYEIYLSGLGLPFLNTDVLALASGMEAYEAASQVAEFRRVMVERRLGFVTETVLSDPVGEKVEFLANAVAEGFDVHLIFIGIATAAMAVERVRSRVKAGGHDVPMEKILARYERTLKNLERAIALVPRVTIYDNSSFENPYRLIAEFRCGELFRETTGKIPSWLRRHIPKK